LSGSSFVLANDSAPMHLASYLDVPVLALFGPSDPKKYGPWGANGRMIKKTIDCPACLGRKNAESHRCMDAISAQEVVETLGALIRP
jgi:ADP-heptose:LPS heptosyltransferase